MSLAILKLDESVDLEFDISISGTSEKISNIRFIIEHSDFALMLKCEQTPQGTRVKVPKLQGILEAGEYISAIEVIVDNKIFRPLTESIEFEPLVEFKMGTTKTQNVTESVKANIKTPMSKNPELDKLLKEGHTQVKYQNFDILKQGDNYVGIILERSVLTSRKKHATLSGLIDELAA